jgi:F-type H+/Na+-transporting ATPase subunit alpha
MKLELAQFRELAAFAQFGSDLDARTKAQLDRGSRIVEMFKQPQLKPISMEIQVGIIWAMQNNYFDDIPVNKIVEAKNSLKQHFEGPQALRHDHHRQGQKDDG